MRGIRFYAIVAAAFMAGAFLASSELRAYAANTVFSTDIKDGEVKTLDLANNAVTSAKIKDGEVKTDDIAPSAIGSLRIKDNDVKAQDLAPDSVGGSEIQGTSKLLFSECRVSSLSPVPAGAATIYSCPAQGAAQGDAAVGSKNGAICFTITRSYASTNFVNYDMMNHCASATPIVETDLYAVIFRK